MRLVKTEHSPELTAFPASSTLLEITTQRGQATDLARATPLAARFPASDEGAIQAFCGQRAAAWDSRDRTRMIVLHGTFNQSSWS